MAYKHILVAVDLSPERANGSSRMEWKIIKSPAEGTMNILLRRKSSPVSQGMFLFAGRLSTCCSISSVISALRICLSPTIWPW